LQGKLAASSYTTAPGFGVSFDLNGSNGTIENLVIGDRLAVTICLPTAVWALVRFDATAAVPEPGAWCCSLSWPSGLGVCRPPPPQVDDSMDKPFVPTWTLYNPAPQDACTFQTGKENLFRD